jgi:hypothetical protein
LRLAQVAGVHAGAPHWPGVPPPPQLWPVGHEPQLRRLPHPSATEPHATPCCAHVIGVHDGVTHWLPDEQSCVGLHGLPQLMMLPHPSDAGPHIRPRPMHVLGKQLAAPHTFGAPPPPHACPDGQSPQWIVPPHPSG